MLKNLEDVAAHLGALHATNEHLSRAVYKATSCGAWAEVLTRPRIERRSERWTARFARVDGQWQALTVSRGDTPVEFSALPQGVREYFLLRSEDAASRSEYLESVAPGAATYDCTDTLLVRYETGNETVFRVGSIVEGTDAEVKPEEVRLPATGDDIDYAICLVEERARDIWDDTHGCEECGRLHALRFSITDEYVWEPGATEVHLECTKCDGMGVSI
jgi:hypothetical protein